MREASKLDAMAASDTSAASDALAVPEAPAEPEVPIGLEAPAEAESQIVLEAPAVSDAPAVPEAPIESDAPTILDTPPVPALPDTSAASDTALEALEAIEALASLAARVQRERATPAAPASPQRQAVRRLYVRTVLGVDTLRSADAPTFASVERLVHRLVDGIDEDDAPWLALTAVRRLAFRARVVETHAVNVAVLAIAMAQRIGLDRGAQAEVGLAALLHDVGQARGAQTERHSIDGAAWLLEWAPFERATLLAAVAAGHCAHGGSAAASSAPPRDDLVTRILRIADAYDVLTGRDAPIGSPDLVLAFLLQGTGARFDTTLLKIFARIVGIYPPGTAVRLRDGAIGVVVRPNRRDDALDRPYVRIVVDGEGRAVEAETIVDLLATGSDIVETLNPAAYGIDPAALALGR